MSLSASLQVQFSGSNEKAEIKTEVFNETEYVPLSELNRLFKASITEDLENSRVNITFYNETLVFLLNSSYFSFRNTVFNFLYPVLLQNEQYYIPLYCLTNALPQAMAQQFCYNEKLQVLKAETPKDNTIRYIVLDPGHGGKDPGAVGSYTKEKDITLQMVQKLKTVLEQKLNVTVYLTRSTDEFVSLQDRTKFANGKKADLFVSLHCNASTARSSNGLEVYFLSTSRTTEARAVEALENSVVDKFEGGQAAVQGYDDLNFILADMMQSEQLEESRTLALRLQSYLTQSTRSNDRGVHQAGFYVLRGAYMPAVLIEMGFITNDVEEKKLNDSAHQDVLVESIYQGIRDFKFMMDQMQ